MPEVQSNTTSAPSERDRTTTSRLKWTDHPVDEVPNYDELPWWPDDEEETSDAKLFPVSDDTEKLLKEAFTEASTNSTQRQWKSKFGDLGSVPT